MIAIYPDAIAGIFEQVLCSDQLSLLPWMGREMSTSQWTVMLCVWGVKAGTARVCWQVKLCDPLYNTCHIWALYRYVYGWTLYNSTYTLLHWSHWVYACLPNENRSFATMAYIGFDIVWSTYCLPSVLWLLKPSIKASYILIQSSNKLTSLHWIEAIYDRLKYERYRHMPVLDRYTVRVGANGRKFIYTALLRHSDSVTINVQ